MNKMMSIILMVIGIVSMGVVSLLYSFSTMEIPTFVYMALWCVCIGVIRMGAGFELRLER